MLESIKRKGAKEKRTILLKLFLKITPDEDTVCRIILFSSTLYVRIFIEKVVRKILSKKSFFVMELQFFFSFSYPCFSPFLKIIVMRYLYYQRTQ